MLQKKQNRTLSFLKLLILSLILSSCKKEDPAPLATADFFVSNNGCIAPCMVHFYDQSTNATSWKWNFGNLFVSTTKNDSITYNLAGTYDVTHWVWNVDDVADSVVKTVEVF